MKLSDRARPRLGGYLAFTDRYECISEIAFVGKWAFAFISVGPYTYTQRTAYIDNPTEFYNDIENNPESAFEHYFGRRIGEAF